MEGSAIRCVVLRNFYFVKAARRIEWCCVVLWVCVLCGFHVVSSFSLKRDFKERTTPFLGNPKPYYFRHIFVRGPLPFQIILARSHKRGKVTARTKM